MRDLSVEEMKRKIEYLERRLAGFGQSCSGHDDDEPLSETDLAVFRVIAEESPNMIFINYRGRIVFVNKACIETMGYSKEEFYTSDFDFFTLIAPESEATIRENYARHLSGEELLPYEYRLITKDGYIFPSIITTKLIRFRDDTAILGIVTDITARKSAEEALRESERKYRSLFDSARVGLFQTRLSDGKVITANEACVSVFGFEKLDAVDKSLQFSTLYYDQERRRQLVDALKRNGRVDDFEIEGKRRDGKRCFFSVSASVYPEKDLIEGFILDISQRKRSENINAALYAISHAVNMADDLNALFSEIHHSLSGIIDTTNFYIALYDKDQNTVEFAYFVDQYDKEQGVLNVRDSGSLTAYVINTNKSLFIKKDELLERYKSRKIKQYGHIPEVWLGVPLRKREELIGVLTVQSYSDPNVYTEGDIELLETIAEQIALAIVKKRAEEENRRLHEQYMQAQKMESIGRLAGTVAHDLNHILTGLVTYPDLLLTEISENDPLRDKIVKIKKSGQRAAAIVEDLQNIARGSITRPEIIDINAIILECLNSPEIRHLQMNDVTIRRSLEPDLRKIKCPRIHILKILYNLVTNAAEAMPGGGEAVISTGRKHVSKPVSGFEYIPEGEYVTLTVGDSGTGIPSSDLKRIFEPYFSRKKLGRSGTGIGLTVVWNIVKENRGYIDVRSEPDNGAQFTVYFPANDEPPVESVEDTAAAVSDPDIRKIMIIDDDEELQTLGCDILERLGYEHVAFGTGNDAVSYLRNNTVDIILLDILLGGRKDGIDVFEEIRELNPDQRAIVISGYSRTDAVKRAKKLGISVFLKKPFTIKDLKNAIDQVRAVPSGNTD